ncbi:MAG: hypothetical protein JXR76_03805 [Deltaproteobacteria bacterium]|nr:hypothetical protein [Deltaproteobacteria bacterium]
MDNAFKDGVQPQMGADWALPKNPSVKCIERASEYDVVRAADVGLAVRVDALEASLETLRRTGVLADSASKRDWRSSWLCRI